MQQGKTKRQQCTKSKQNTLRIEARLNEFEMSVKITWATENDSQQNWLEKLIRE